ncbi:hypothetical protein GCM10007939_10420 [Amylibacter marinus]|uniref:BD-FAE-like domain-containing protein n=1 Tax=Amylibacter marinus TaxID=1475483 RepID=A0ABQ5VUD9_9RHOB|nr:hypothetical protein GCM10007939_10420 [Amylibacter marinus]
MKTALCVILNILALGTAVLADVTKHSDIPYGADPLHRMDIYVPKQARGAPVIAMVHGGGWHIGDKSNAGVVDNKRDYWTKRGYIFVSINYRKMPQSDPYTQATDVARSFAYIQKNITKYGGSAGKLIAMGHSAGAHLVALVHTDIGMRNRFGVKKWSGSVLLDSAAFNLPNLMRNDPPKIYLKAFGNSPAFWKKASPAHALKSAPSPMLIVCSTMRKIACSDGNSFAKLAQKRGGAAQVLPLNKSHSAINKTLGKSPRYTQQVHNWIKQTLKN